LRDGALSNISGVLHTPSGVAIHVRRQT
jgi:hypothetical protein